VPDVPNVTLVGDSAQVIPVEGVTLEVSATLPVNPWSAVIVTIEVPEAPASAVTVVGLAETVKS